jgi:DNA recombination protein RmuC
MEIMLALIIIVLAAAVVALLLRQNQRPDTAPLEHIGQQLQQTTSLVLQQLDRQRESSERTNGMMHTRIDHATRVVSDVQGKLAQLEEANKRIFELGKDISRLQQVLQAPKLRGTMGEIWLQELIGQILPSESYKMQYPFRSGETCDAAIFLNGGLLLPVDSKFSLENFVRMMEADEDQRSTYRKQFAADTRRRVDEIARKYILPEEGTMDFAFMYVPAENVYYQAFIQSDDEPNLLNYAFSKKIIPVSPSSFYAYLQVILFGLKGMDIEKSAKQIQKNLVGLQGEFGKFKDAYEKVGIHLRHAQASYDQADKRVIRIGYKFETLSHAEQQLIEEADAND